MTSDPGDPIGEGRSYNYTAATGAFYAQPIQANGLTFTYYEFSHIWSLTFVPPAGETLVAGTYPGATRWLSETGIRPRIAVRADGREADPLTGSFTIHEIEREGNAIASLHATFEFHSGEKIPALHGELRFKSTPQPLEITLPPRAATVSNVVPLWPMIADRRGTAAPLSYHWEATSPAGVTFGDPSAPQTFAYFDAPGEYRLTLTVTDGVNTATGSMLTRVLDCHGRWSGLTHLPGTENPAYIRITLSQNRHFTGALRTGGRVVALRGAFVDSRTAVVPIKVGGVDATLTLSMLTDGRLSTELEYMGSTAPAILALDQREQPDPALVGSYAFAFQTATNPAYGWSRVTVRRSGAVALVGSLPDGTRVSTSASLDSDRHFLALFTSAGRRDSLWIDSTRHGDAWEATGHSSSRRYGVSDLFIFTSRALKLTGAREPISDHAGPIKADLALGLPDRRSMLMPFTAYPGGRVADIGRVQTVVSSVFFVGPLFELRKFSLRDMGYSLATLKIQATGIYSGFLVDPQTRQALRFGGLLLPEYKRGFGYAAGPNVFGASEIQTIGTASLDDRLSYLATDPRTEPGR